MKKNGLMYVVVVVLMMSVIPSNVFAGDFVTTVHKSFEQLGPPHEEVRVGMRVVTKFEHQEGGRKDHERGKALAMHDFLTRELADRGWREDELAIDDVQAKSIEFIFARRATVFVNECEFPGSEYPYRGERGDSFKEYFATNINKMEECLVYNKELKEDGVRRR